MPTKTEAHPQVASTGSSPTSVCTAGSPKPRIEIPRLDFSRKSKPTPLPVQQPSAMAASSTQSANKPPPVIPLVSIPEPSGRFVDAATSPGTPQHRRNTATSPRRPIALEDALELAEFLLEPAHPWKMPRQEAPASPPPPPPPLPPQTYPFRPRLNAASRLFAKSSSPAGTARALIAALQQVGDRCQDAPQSISVELGLMTSITADSEADNCMLTLMKSRPSVLIQSHQSKSKQSQSAKGQQSSMRASRDRQSICVGAYASSRVPHPKNRTRHSKGFSLGPTLLTDGKTVFQ